MSERLTAIIGKGPDARRLNIKGRAAWALRHLVMAGDEGLTAFDAPGPRWSDYVFKLRKAGVPVETIHEHHGGNFPGTHARYRLTAAVEITGVAA